MQRRCWIAAVIERQRAEICYREDTEACAYNRLRIVEGTPRQRHARLKIALIRVAERLRQMVLARRDIFGAGQRRVIQIAGVEGLPERQVRAFEILLR